MLLSFLEFLFSVSVMWLNHHFSHHFLMLDCWDLILFLSKDAGGRWVTSFIPGNTSFFYSYKDILALCCWPFLSYTPALLLTPRSNKNTYHVLFCSFKWKAFGIETILGGNQVNLCLYTGTYQLHDLVEEEKNIFSSTLLVSLPRALQIKLIKDRLTE